LNSTENIIAVIACGGESQRMGVAKSLINYHGVAQWQYLSEQCKAINLPVYLSIRKEQASDYPADCKLIIDQEHYKDHGPMSGLLSAFESFPDKAILYVGCDYPLIDRTDILSLVNSYNDVGTASYFGENYEPLLSIYSPACHKEMLNNFASGKFSLSHFLAEINAVKISPVDIRKIKSIDTIEEQKELMDFLKNNS
jgi:molybdopterin-guanine dinucleotide biosynthesis protein A